MDGSAGVGLARRARARRFALRTSNDVQLGHGIQDRETEPPLVPEPAFTRARILRALEALGDELTCEGVRGQIFIVGGAAMALAYSTRRVVSPGSSRSWLTWLLQVDETVGELLVGDVTDRCNQGADAGRTAREPG
jgi:hypothetical protein